MKEKRTGNVNFGASVGQGTGPADSASTSRTCLASAKGSLQWQFGRYIRDFSMSYTDPRIKQTNAPARPRSTISGRGSSFATSVSRTLPADSSSSKWPLLNSRYTRFYVSYGGERVSYGGDGLVGTIQCNGCFRSTVGFTLDHDTRLGQPFPVQGTHENVALQLNGGPLGGSASFQRVTTEARSYSTLATFGSGIGPEPMALVFGLTARAGALSGDPGPFFVSQAFSLGGGSVRQSAARI